MLRFIEYDDHLRAFRHYPYHENESPDVERFGHGTTGIQRTGQRQELSYNDTGRWRFAADFYKARRGSNIQRNDKKH